MSLSATERKRRWRKKYPMKAAFENLKHNSKRRKKDFSLTFSQFKKFAIKYNYLAGKGRTAEAYHINRIEPSKGYSIDNIQVLTNSENLKKRHGTLDSYWDDHIGEMVYRTRINQEVIITEDDCPF